MPHRPKIETRVGEVLHSFAPDEGLSPPGSPTEPSSGSQDDQPAQKALEVKLVQEELLETHSTLCLPPHLPKPHSNGRGVPHRASRGVHDPLSCFWIYHPHPNDSPQESLVRIGWLLSSEPFKFFMVKKGLHPKIVVYPQGLKLLGQGEVCEDHVMDLSRRKSVFIKRRPDLFRHTCCPDR